jgi:NAD dependent epimerase/dehydratase family enzyme
MSLRVVVVGATGQIGRPLCGELVRDGHVVVVFSRDPLRAVPSPLVRMGLGVVTDILIRGQRVIPARASALGYEFAFPDLDAALRDLLGQADRSIAVTR